MLLQDLNINYCLIGSKRYQSEPLNTFFRRFFFFLPIDVFCLFLGICGFPVHEMGFSKAHYICFGLFQAHLVQISSAKGVVEA